MVSGRFSIIAAVMAARMVPQRSLAPAPEFASADFRLGKMTACTTGPKYGRRLGDRRSFDVRVEYYVQMNEAPSNGAEPIPGFDLYPEVHAGIVQFDYSLE